MLLLFLLCCSGPEAGGELVSAMLVRPGLLSVAAFRFDFLVGNGEIILTQPEDRGMDE